MSAVVLLEWTFSPPDYFEQPIELSRDDYTMTIADGKAEATIDAAVYDANPSMRETLHNELKDRFLAAQLLTHRGYELSKSAVTRVHPDGRRELSVEAEARITFTAHASDVRVVDKDGAITADSKQERIEKEQRLAELLIKHRSNDEVLDSLVRSFDAAVRDPDNELVHLYEIRDALAAKFGKTDLVRERLGISRSDWSRLGRLCNNEPLRQGRHRGENIGDLRDATDTELADARRIAFAMIKAYLHHLDGTLNADGPS